MQKNKGSISEFTNGKVPGSLSLDFSGSKPSKAQKRQTAGVAVQRSRNPTPNKGQFVRQTIVGLIALALIASLLPGSSMALYKKTVAPKSVLGDTRMPSPKTFRKIFPTELLVRHHRI